MLEALIEYARDERLVTEPGFAPKKVTWIAALDDVGSLIDVKRALGPHSRGPKSFVCCPDMQFADVRSLPNALQRLGHPAAQAAHFLTDSCSVVALLKDSKSDDATMAQKHSTFRLLVALASHEHPLLRAIHTAITAERTIECLHQMLVQQGARATDRISFSVDGANILDSDVWHPWWRSFRQQLGQKVRGRVAVCLATGMLGVPLSTHPKITELGSTALTYGESFITFDKKAFQSFGLDAGENAAVGTDAAWAYRAAMNKLLVDALHFGQLRVICWSGAGSNCNIDPVRVLFAPTEPREDGTLLDHIRERFAEHQSTNDLSSRQLLHTAALIGTKARLRVRFWHTATVTEINRAAVKWFDDLEIVHASGRGHAVPVGLDEILFSLQRAKDPKEDVENYLRPLQTLQLSIYHAALDPEMPIPEAAVIKIINAFRSDFENGNFHDAMMQAESNRGDHRSLPRFHARMGVLKAFAVRGGFPETLAELNPSHCNAAYHCGRLVAVLTAVRVAVANCVSDERNYQLGLSQTLARPTEMINLLTMNSEHSISQIAKTRRDFAKVLEFRLIEIWAAIAGRIKSKFSVIEQALFILGYHQQLASDRKRRSGSSDDPNEKFGTTFRSEEEDT